MLTDSQLDEMRLAATSGHLSHWGLIDEEPDPDPVIHLKRSELAHIQRLLLAAVEEVERLRHEASP